MKWMRFEHRGREGIGILHGTRLQPHAGDPLGEHTPLGEALEVTEVRALPPSRPGQIIGLWNNFHAAAHKNGWTVPEEPLYFLKSPSALAGHGAAIPAPPESIGRVAYEGELVIVIGRRTRGVSADQAGAHIWGYSCGNDVTAIELLQRDPSFVQWTRAKSLSGFAACGPVVETDFDPATARLRTRVGGRQRQDYALADMIFPPHDLVARLSQDLTLEAGDLIYCGTSLGVLPMKPGSTVEVEVDGIGTLVNTFG